ncbi:hypothetical protein [Candidatus Phytoplasma tritici]|uniref:hypothetical protein n=1 Tax=Candidatus Phytoplasma tritici TaxID=321961 RepID=UPI0004197EFA|nr:hypothetical protein [Candidatus Phytoplasma tritici]
MNKTNKLKLKDKKVFLIGSLIIVTFIFAMIWAAKMALQKDTTTKGGLKSEQFGLTLDHEVTQAFDTDNKVLVALDELLQDEGTETKKKTEVHKVSIKSSVQKDNTKQYLLKIEKPVLKVNGQDKTNKFGFNVFVKVEGDSDFKIYKASEKPKFVKDKKFVPAEIKIVVELNTLEDLLGEGVQLDNFELTMSYEVVDEDGKQIGTNDEKLDEAQKTPSVLQDSNEF